MHSGVDIYFECPFCKLRFSTPKLLQEHRLKEHDNFTGDIFYLYKTLWDKFKIYRHICSPDKITSDQCFTQDIRNSIKKILLNELTYSSMIKFSLIFTAEFLMSNHAEEITESQQFPIRTAVKTVLILDINQLDNIINNVIHDISIRLDDIIAQGSGWVQNDGISVDIEITHIKPLSGGMFYPYAYANKNRINFYNAKYIHTIQNNDYRCFYYAVAASFICENENFNSDFTPYNKFAESNFNTESFSIPFKVNDVHRFELKNKHLDMCINILYTGIYDKITGIYPAYISKRNSCSRIINLLLTLDEYDHNHYHLILDVNKFLRKTYKKYTISKKSYAKQFFCLNCMHPFSSDKNLTSHEKDCYLFKGQEINLMQGGIQFNKKNNGTVQIVGFFDFECYNEIFICDVCMNKNCICSRKTKTLVNQKAICFSVLIMDSIKDEILFEKTYTGYDAATRLLQSVSHLEKFMTQYLKINYPLIMTAAENEIFENAENCYLCNKIFSLTDIDMGDHDKKVRDHCHNTGVFLGAAHNSCNLYRRSQYKIPLYCHNFIGYDSHLLINALKHLDPNLYKIIVLPKNLEQITNLQVGIFTYNDSISFLKASLNELVSDLKTENHDFTYLKKLDCLKNEKNYDLYKEKFDLITSKGIFPYDFVTSIDQLTECVKIPDKKFFFNTLTNEEICDSDYKKAIKVFNIFQHKNMVEYMEFYCKLDVYLLCEVFNKFRKNAIKDFELDPAQFLSLPSFAYEAMLKLTKVCIGSCTDIDMYNMIKKGVRGGHSFISERALKVREHDDEELNDFINKSQNSDFIYVDCNNLYGSAMSYKMPMGDYEWMNVEELQQLDIENIDLSSDDLGIIAEVDLEVSYIIIVILKLILIIYYFLVSSRIT
jgi:hypothetical protein